MTFFVSCLEDLRSDCTRVEGPAIKVGGSALSLLSFIQDPDSLYGIGTCFELPSLIQLDDIVKVLEGNRGQ